MDAAWWAALAALLGVLVPMGTVLWRLAVSQTETKQNAASAKSAADAAMVAVEKHASTNTLAIAAARLEIANLERELVNHRVDVAREYVSHQTLGVWRSEVVAAINGLGDRIDRLFNSKPL